MTAREYRLVVCDACVPRFRPLYAKVCGVAGSNLPGLEDDSTDGVECDLCGRDLSAPDLLPQDELSLFSGPPRA